MCRVEEQPLWGLSCRYPNWPISMCAKLFFFWTFGAPINRSIMNPYKLKHKISTWNFFFIFCGGLGLTGWDSIATTKTTYNNDVPFLDSRSEGMARGEDEVNSTVTDDTERWPITYVMHSLEQTFLIFYNKTRLSLYSCISLKRCFFK